VNTLESCKILCAGEARKNAANCVKFDFDATVVPPCWFHTTDAETHYGTGITQYKLLDACPDPSGIVLREVTKVLRLKCGEHSIRGLLTSTYKNTT
jgi:hypothetical protein